MEESSRHDYEVFLSFRGPDTRAGIADYLYVNMIDAGIRAYRDNDELRTGEEIGGQLLKAIEQSKISIPIFSKGYADSPWCLRELVKMVESKNTRGHKIMPIFYDVAPSEVKYQTEHYGNAIVSHAKKKRFDDETINKWKVALNEVGALKGWDLQSMPNRGEGEFAKEVVNNVLTELKVAYLKVSDFLVEVEDHEDEIMRMIAARNAETKIVGIYGIGGMGKTTLAKIVYNRLSKDFPYCCFLSNIREKDITCLQKQLISTICRGQCSDINNITEGAKEIERRLGNNKVLLLLDDADKESQLDALVQEREWFAKGSKIIITTRDRGILKLPTPDDETCKTALVDEAYELTGMDFDHSLKLFSKHAFRRDYPLEQYVSLSKRAVNICHGLPLALELIGSLLSGKRVENWDALLKELEECPLEGIEKSLIISIRALNDNERRIFLDVACFFIGCDKRTVIHMWKSCNYNPHQSLEVLLQRSLIKIKKGNQLWMHDLLRDIGRNFIQQGSDMKPEKQQLVWTHDQALDILEKMQSGGGVHGNGSIEAICLELTKLSRYSLLKEFLESLSNLRFLQMDFKLSPQPSSWFMSYLVGDYIKKISRSNLLECLSSPLFLRKSRLILPELRWLSWNIFPYTFELSCISMRKLVILDFSRSRICETWYGWSHIKVAKNLKVLNLTNCNFRKTPDLSYHKNLEQLILEGCELLAEIDSSIGHLKNLVFLNLKDCKSLQKLPDEMGALESLTEFLLDYSTSIKEIPEWRRMKNLKILSLAGCTSLNKFNFLGCSASAVELSLVDNRFNSLIELDLSSTGIRVLPDSIGYMKKLKVLKLHNCPLRKIPSAIGMLEKLEQLEVGGLGGLVPPVLKEIKIEIRIGKLPISKEMPFVGREIPMMPQLPESLITLTIKSFLLNKPPDLSNLLNLRNLNLDVSFKHPFKLDLDPSSWGIGRLRMLEVLKLKSYDTGTSSLSLVLFSKLKELQIECHNLQCLPRLPMNLSSLRIWDCERIKTTNDISHLKVLSRLEIHGCHELIEIEGLEGLENLRRLDLRSLSLAKLPDLTSLKKLKKIYLGSCHQLVEIPDCPESLETLKIRFCRLLKEPSDPSSFKNLDFSRYICRDFFERNSDPGEEKESFLFVEENQKIT